MESFLQIFVLIPLLAFTLMLLTTGRYQRFIPWMAVVSGFICMVSVTVITSIWIISGYPVLNIKHISFINAGDVEIFIDFYFDRTTATFGLTGNVLAFVTAIYSKQYFKSAAGLKRYFLILTFFHLGYSFAVFSGNFETLFIGWEMMGVSSFLMISFYRHRFLPVNNSLKVVSINRLGDICLILAMWMIHHVWSENVTYTSIGGTQVVSDFVLDNPYPSFIVVMLILAATTKSAQFPFSHWLPRAMEAPRPASAMLYGALSAHLGVFLLIRTSPMWNTMPGMPTLIVCIGVLTTFFAFTTARVQASRNAQIAYGTITQMGLMFIEIGLGYNDLALMHFGGNAFLRTYQILHSRELDKIPVGKYLQPNTTTGLYQKIKNTIWMHSVREWKIEMYLKKILWNPFKLIGSQLNFVNKGTAYALMIIIYSFGIYLNYNREEFSASLIYAYPFMLSFIGLLLILRSFAEMGEATKAWSYAIIGQFFISLSVSLLNKDYGYGLMSLYLSGSIGSAIIGYICLQKIKLLDNDIWLGKYHGYAHENSTTGVVFLLACIGAIGLPFTPTFIGIDLLFSHIEKQEQILILFTAISFLFIELAILRIYARIFLGPSKKEAPQDSFKYL